MSLGSTLQAVMHAGAMERSAKFYDQMWSVRTPGLSSVILGTWLCDSFISGAIGGHGTRCVQFERAIRDSVDLSWHSVRRKQKKLLKIAERTFLQTAWGEAA
jgi:hypothetical protein